MHDGFLLSFSDVVNKGTRVAACADAEGIDS